MSATSEPNRRIFDVPLSCQRYQWVQKCIEDDPSIRSVTDLGCGNGRLNVWLRTIGHLELINYIDCDYHLLNDQIDFHFMPPFMEMLMGRQEADKALQINVYHGDITVPYDLLSADCFVMVEVIEHMLMDHVDQACRAIFGYYQPKTVIITTPNSEFNHLLRQEGEPADKFRHFDHKFEWTRAEFQHWAQVVCNNYPYSVHFDGVGHLPGSEPYGPCTQIAVFRQIASGEKLDRNTFLCDDTDNSNDLRESQLDRQNIKKIGEYTVPGCRIKAEPPLTYEDGFNWGRDEAFPVEENIEPT